MTHLSKISVSDAAELIQQDKAILVDIREPDETARLSIAGAVRLPMTRVNKGDRLPGSDRTIIFTCRSGQRTSINTSKLAALCDSDAYQLDGGLIAWENAGLEVIKNKKAPLEIIRQVHITAGLLILTGVLLGTYVNPGFYGISAFVGAGLTFAGVTGWCGMAMLLSRMPWNREPTPLANRAAAE